MLVVEVGDDLECCNWTVEDRPVEFSDNIGATLVLRYDDDGTKIPCTHFAIKGLLDSGVSDEDKVAELDVVLNNGGGMLLLKTDGGFDSCGVDIGGEGCQVRLMFLQGGSTPSNEVG